MDTQKYISVMNQIDIIMKNDKEQEDNMDDVHDILRLAIRSNDFINSIKLKIDDIMLDHKLDYNDIPIIISIILESLTFLKQLNDGKYKMNKVTSKYVIQGIILYVLSDMKIDNELITSFNILYPSLFNLISFDPKELISKVKICFGKCCRKTT